MHDETLRFLDGEPAPAAETGAATAAPGLDSTPADPAPAARGRRHPRWPGVLSVALGILTGVLTGVGIAVASDGGFAVATALAWTAVAVSVVGAIVGIAAIFARLGRPWGAAGTALCLLANPVILTAVLGAAAGLA